MEAQARLAMDNLAPAANRADLGLENIFKCTMTTGVFGSLSGAQIAEVRRCG
jgi:hypothetical protein